MTDNGGLRISTLKREEGEFFLFLFFFRLRILSITSSVRGVCKASKEQEFLVRRHFRIVRITHAYYYKFSLVEPRGGGEGGVYHRAVSPSEKISLFTEEVERRLAKGEAVPTLLVNPKDPTNPTTATLTEEARRPDLDEMSRSTGDQPATAQQVAEYLNRP